MVKPQVVLGTPGNLELQSLERRGTAELIFIVSLIVHRCTGFVGHLRDIDAGHVGYTRGFRISSSMVPFTSWAVVQATLGVISEEI